MYVNYINDRKSSGYQCLIDVQCGNELVFITDSSLLFVKNATLSGKRKIFVIILGVMFVFGDVKCVEAIGTSLSSQPEVAPIISNENTNKVIQPKIMVPSSNKKIINYRELILPPHLYLIEDKYFLRPETLSVIQEMRGGNGFPVAVLGNIAFLLLFYAIVTFASGFVPNTPNPGWGLERPNPFQPPTTPQHSYPPGYDLFFPRRTCYADRPGGSSMMAKANRQSSREELTQLSTDVVPTQTQMSGFVENGKINLNKCLNEVNRRALEIGCPNFECSLDRFIALATENGKLSNATAREAITVLQGEMEGYYKNPRREKYGLNVTGLDFLVDGLGEFKNITHVEIKNPVGSAIKIANGQEASISRQGRKIGEKLVYQQNRWSNTSKTNAIKTLNRTASLPQSPNNVLGLVDNFDVPSSEKTLMEGSILKGSKNNTNIIFLNNN